MIKSRPDLKVDPLDKQDPLARRPRSRPPKRRAISFDRVQAEFVFCESARQRSGDVDTGAAARSVVADLRSYRATQTKAPSTPVSSSTVCFAKQGITRSISCRGDVWDNSAMESFFSSLKAEPVNGKVTALATMPRRMHPTTWRAYNA